MESLRAKRAGVRFRFWRRGRSPATSCQSDFVRAYWRAGDEPEMLDKVIVAGLTRALKVLSVIVFTTFILCVSPIRN